LYPTIWFSSAIPALRESITLACKQFGLSISNWRDVNNSAYITNKGDVFKYYKVVGFKNSKHLLRWARFNKAPIV